MKGEEANNKKARNPLSNHDKLGANQKESQKNSRDQANSSEKSRLEAELKDINRLSQNVSHLTDALKEETETDEAIYRRSLMEIDIEREKEKKNQGVSSEDILEWKTKLTDEWIIEQSLLIPENEGTESMELIESLPLCGHGIAFFQSTPLFNPDNLRMLKDLDLSKNKLTTLSSFRSFFRLETLNLTNNFIGSLIGLEDCLSLQRLYLNDNLVESIHEAKDLKELEVLELANNRLKNFGGVIQTIQELPKLKDLALKGNSVEHVYSSFRGYPTTSTKSYLKRNLPD